MNRIVVWVGLSLSCFLLGAESPDGGGSWLNVDWEKLTAPIVLAGVLGFIIMKMLPELHNKFIEQTNIFAATLKEQTSIFSETAKEVQLHFSEVLDKIDARVAEREKAHHEDQQAVAKSLLDLTTQCARRQAQEVKPPV